MLLCFTLLFNTVAFAVDSQPNAVVESISIYKRSGILEGETIQLEADVEASGSLFDSVVWSSSDPSVISCTEDGKIKGLVAGKAATITCKAKWGSEKVSIRVYCVEKLPEEVKSGFENIVTFIYSYPGIDIYSLTDSIIKDISIDWFSFISLFYTAFGTLYPVLSNTSSNVFVGSKVSVLGRVNNYAYIRYGENNSRDGFVKFSKLKKTISGFLNLSATEISLWADGNNYSTGILTTDYDGNVEWKVDDEDYASYDDVAGQITGKIPGKVVTVTATADGMTAECKVRLLYKWPQVWVTETNKDTQLYKMNGTGFTEKRSLKSGSNFTVYGDCGTDAGWVFGCHKIGDTANWGYIPIEDVSTKNTISYYNNFNIGYPIKDKSISYISSTYAERTSDLHRGFDITGGGSYIYGKELVSPVNGTVVFTNTSCTNNNKSPSYGYCITIESDGGDYPQTAIKDSVTNKHFTITFMHMSEPPILREGDTVEAGDVVGKIGNTGNVSGSPGVNPIGTHLHFEINNMAVIMGSTLRSDFTYNINPIYFYMDFDFKFNTGSSAYLNCGAYWYGPDRKE